MTETIVAPYIETLVNWLRSIDASAKTIVDLGCGDFRVGSQYAHLARRYIGADIVKPLIDHHIRVHRTDTIDFCHLNLIEDELPDGDVAILRQVLQHLSNDQISKILSKLSKYRWVVITEHQLTGPCPRPNLDKPQGGDIRLFDHSALYLDEPPFSIPVDRLQLLLEVKSSPVREDLDPGVIRTFLLSNP